MDMHGVKSFLGSKYFRIKSSVYIDKRLMNLLTVFFGLFGMPNFVTKRYSQGIIHLLLLFLVIMGISIFGGYFVSMPWGPILVVASYGLAFFETKAYNLQVDELKKCRIDVVGTDSQENSEVQDGNAVFVEEIDKNFLVSGYTSILLSFLIVLIEIYCIYLLISSASAGDGHIAALGGVFAIIIGIVIIVPLFVGIFRCREYLVQFKKDLMRISGLMAKRRSLLSVVNIMFWCDIVLAFSTVFVFAYLYII